MRGTKKSASFIFPTLARWGTPAILYRSMGNNKFSVQTRQAAIPGGNQPMGCFRCLENRVLNGNFLQFLARRTIIPPGMTQPLALVVYEKLLPGTQLVNRLQDLNYRVRAVTDSNNLVNVARQEKPMLVLADLASTKSDVCKVIAELRNDAATQHIPVIAIAREGDSALLKAAQAAGATLVAGDAAILNHLSQFLDQALQVE
jgi:CheY-like chemotaxis protein